MEKNINEINSSQFRSTIKSLGFTEKGSELTSGGDIKSDFLDIMNALVSEWKKTGGSNCPLKFTSGNDKYHKTVGYASRHSKGEAMDATLPSGCHSAFINLLNSYKRKYNGFSYIDEYRNPSSKATGGHFHMSYRAGQPEGSKESIEQPNSLSSGNSTQTGDIDTYSDTEFLGNLYSQALGLKSLTKSIAGIQEDIQRIKKLMK